MRKMIKVTDDIFGELQNSYLEREFKDYEIIELPRELLHRMTDYEVDQINVEDVVNGILDWIKTIGVPGQDVILFHLAEFSILTRAVPELMKLDYEVIYSRLKYNYRDSQSITHSFKKY